MTLAEDNVTLDGDAGQMLVRERISALPGETIGMSDEERIPIEHGPSFRDEAMTVVRLEMP